MIRCAVQGVGGLANPVYISAWDGVVNGMARVLGWRYRSAHVALRLRSMLITVVVDIVITKNNVDVVAVLVLHEQVPE